MKLSIVIPTYNHAEEFLRPCLESIRQYTDLSDAEVLVVANGCIDNTKECVESFGDPFKLLWFDEPLGYTRASNIGIEAAKGDYILLLNNDTVVLDQVKNYWIETLLEPFSDPLMGITGALESDCQYSGSRFLIFCCVLISRKLIEKIGLLDEIFSPGYGEDADYCKRATKAGFKFKQVCEITGQDDHIKCMIGTFPFYHRGEGTFDGEPGFIDVIKRNRKILTYRWNTSPLKLNLGCGFLTLGGYVNIDFFNSEKADLEWDIRKLDVFLDGSVDEVYLRHVFEHLEPREATTTLQEWFRILKPGARIIIEVPDIVAICREVAENNVPQGRMYQLLDGIYGTPNPECPHRFGWERSILFDHLSWAGFTRIQELPDYYTHGQGWPSLNVEAFKPIPEPIAIEPKSKIIDAFIFYNELELLETRLNTLNSVVDQFVIVESTTSHRGYPKPLYFQDNIERFKDFMHKIVHVVVEDSPNIPDDPWANERHQRDCIMRGLTGLNDNDIVILGDADEIANPEAVLSYKPEMGLCRFEQDFFYYYLNCKCITQKWDWLKILSYGMLKTMSPCEVRYKPSISEVEVPFIRNGGWHFSCMGGVDQFINKIKNFAHSELDRDEYLADKEKLQAKIDNGEDIFGRDFLKFDYVWVDDKFPEYVQDNQESLISKGFIKNLMPSVESQLEYGNQYERAAIGKTDVIPGREYARYKWASSNIVGNKVLEVGCSSGYGLRILPQNLIYTGLDLDPKIISFAKSSFGDRGTFEVADINTYDLDYYDTIIAFEVIEHLDNGLELVERLKKHCKCLLITVPYNEPPGRLGPHHKLHHLTQYHFKDFTFNWLIEGPNGSKLVDYAVKNEIMVGKWVREQILPQGWFDDGDIDSYRSFMKLMPNNAFVAEIGVWKGRSLCSVADIIKDKNISVIAIDTFKGTQSSELERAFHIEATYIDIKTLFEENIEKFGIRDNVTVVPVSSLEASNRYNNGFFDMVFLDGDHEYSAFKADQDTWWEKVKPGGILAGHDYQWPGIQQALQEKFGSVETNWNNIWYVKKENVVVNITEEDVSTIPLGAYNAPPYERHTITVTISTKNRYVDLKLALSSLLVQSLSPDRIIIFDDNDTPKDLRDDSTYENLFKAFDSKDIKWEVIYGGKVGQVHNHALALDIVREGYIFRMDDDHVLESNVLEKLYRLLSSPKVGAVAGSVYHPGRIASRPDFTSSKIEDIYLGANEQWYKQPAQVFEVDHLYSTFMFKLEAAKHGYNKKLSRIGHREETIFTYEMKRAGWDLLLDTSAITWHFQSKGGIRSYSSDSMWKHDEEIFSKKLQEWGVNPTKVKLIVLDCGLGDHLAFKTILPEIKRKYADHRLILSLCYLEPFEADNDIIKISIAEASHFNANFDEHNVYKYLWDQKSIGRDLHLIQAYKELYLGNNSNFTV